MRVPPVMPGFCLAICTGDFNEGIGVAWDEFVGYEYAFVRRAYRKLKIPERTEIDWFEGGHEIDLEPTVRFLDRFLQEP